MYRYQEADTFKQSPTGKILLKSLSSLLSPLKEERVLLFLFSLATGVPGSVRFKEKLYLSLVEEVISRY